MPILWDFGSADSNSQPTHRPRVARAVQPVEQSIGARRPEQFSHRILWHGVESATEPAALSRKNGSETLGEGAR